MQSIELSDVEIILLEAIVALGGKAHISELKGAVRWQIRRNTHKALGALQEQGLINRYARGCYVLTSVGRDALGATLPVGRTRDSETVR